MTVPEPPIPGKRKDITISTCVGKFKFEHDELCWQVLDCPLGDAAMEYAEKYMQIDRNELPPGMIVQLGQHLYTIADLICDLIDAGMYQRLNKRDFANLIDNASSAMIERLIEDIECIEEVPPEECPPTPACYLCGHPNNDDGTCTRQGCGDSH